MLVRAMPTPIRIEHMHAIFEVTDARLLNREHIRVPLGATGDGAIDVRDGVLHITVPEVVPFDEWVATLGDALDAIDLSTIPRSEP